VRLTLLVPDVAFAGARNGSTPLPRDRRLAQDGSRNSRQASLDGEQDALARENARRRGATQELREMALAKPQIVERQGVLLWRKP
jgi:hypothetical protein